MTKKNFLTHHVTKYIIAGILATIVNFGVFAMLRSYMDLTLANFISITSAIIFAYFVNARFVFYSKAQTAVEIIKELSTFFSARLITMLIELVGVWFLVEQIHQNDIFSKIIINIIVLILNYIFSKFIFHKK